MKILILGDLHIGARNANALFLRQTDDFLKNTLFPYIEENCITTVIQLGDILDKRKSIDFITTQFLYKNFFEYFAKNRIKLISVLGNHDLYYKNTTEISGLELLGNVIGSEYIDIVSEPTIRTIGDNDFKLIPWVCDANKEACKNILSADTKNTSVACGHFELAGFLAQSGYTTTHGTLEEDDFKNVKHVFSGHYHTPSDKGNIHYVGTPYALTWNDYGDKKKFIEYDTETMEYREIFNDKTLFHKIIYEPNKKFVYDANIPEGAYLKVVVTGLDDLMDIYISNLYDNYKPSKCQIIDATDVDIDDNSENITLTIDNPIEIMMSIVDTMKNVDTDFIKKELFDIYKEAMTRNANIS